jgi:hypothetical protein
MFLTTGQESQMNYSNSQGASMLPAAELPAEQGGGLDRRLTGVSPFPVQR